MPKTPPAAPVDFESLWGTYSKWQQEDLHRYEYQKEQYDVTKSGYTKAEGAERARLSSTGVATDSDLWDSRINDIRKDIPDFEAEYEESKQKLRDSTLYEQLFGGPLKLAAGSPINDRVNFFETNSSGLIFKSIDDIQAQKESLYSELYDTPEVDNIYEPTEVQAEQNDSANRAKAAASGRRIGMGEEEEEQSPWI